MAYNGSGTFVRLYNWVADKAGGLKIIASRMDAEMDGFATGLSNAITKDGQTTITANIPFNNRRITGLGDAAAATDAMNRQTADGRYLQLATAQTITGTKTVAGAALNLAQGTNIASAATTDIGAATGNYVVVTGTTTITALGTIQAGTGRVVRFAGALTLTHNATSLILPTGANIVTAPGDIAVFVSEGGGNWRCTSFERASGIPLSAPSGSVINSTYAEYTANASLTAVLPYDDTIPQSTEGTQILSVSLTPTSATNKVRVRFQCQAAGNGANVVAGAALFVNSDINAVRASFTVFPSATDIGAVGFEYLHTPGAITAQTYAVRMGPRATETIRLNGTTGARIYGGVSAATLVVEEIKA